MARILIAGCGYVGSALGEQLAADAHVVWGLRRRVAGLPGALRPVEADLTLPITLRELPGDLDTVIYAASPGGSDDPLYRAAYVDGLRNLLEALRAAGEHPARIFFLSSTAVYGQQNGEWVDEDSPTRPGHFSGRRLLEAERLLWESPFPATAVRLGGIYGPRRTQLLDSVRAGRATYRDAPPRYTNRIHLADCVGALRHLMGLPDLASVYLGVDEEPASERTVMQWMAGVLGAPYPRPASEQRPPSRPARGNKRCRNARLKASGYRFRYPTFREGYRALIEAAT